MGDGTSIAVDQDLWVFTGDKLKIGIPENGRIREQKQGYLRNKSYPHDVTSRAEPYMYWITRQAKKHNMPMELVLLPIMESAFDPRAMSGTNVAGIWQIIPSTGRNYGLKQTRSYSTHRDAMASTAAALDMTQCLNRVFDGGQLLIVAVYNNGEGRAMKTIKTNKARDKLTDFWLLPLPQETKPYMPKMLALSDIFKNSKRCGVCPLTTDEGRALARVHLSSPVETTQVADMAGIFVSKLETFDIGVRGSILGVSGSQYVMAPKKHVERLRKPPASDETVTIQSMLVANDTPLNSRNYKVRPGNALSGIMSRLGVSANDLRQRNSLRGSSLKASQNLTMSAGTSAQRPANNSDSIIYHVRKGDSSSNIAKCHGANIKGVIRRNNDTDNLQPGDQLTLLAKNNGVSDS